jgi:CRP-like cAMP-binding protein
MAGNVLFEKYGRTIDPGRVIFNEGDDGDTMYIIQEGQVRISKDIEGRQHTLAELGKGDFFGEMAIVSQMKRSATATAIDRVQLLSFDRQGFQGMIEKNSKIALNVIDKLCRRLQNANNQIQFLFKRNERSVMALNLYHLFTDREVGTRLSLDRIRQEISMSLVVPLDLVNNVLKELEAAGIVEIKGNSVRLLDRTRLAAVANATEDAGGM